MTLNDNIPNLDIAINKNIKLIEEINLKFEHINIQLTNELIKPFKTINNYFKDSRKKKRRHSI